MHQVWRRPAIARWLLQCLWIIGVALWISSAKAQSITVTNALDAGPGSLRQAMLDALADPAPGAITFASSANGVITLASPLPSLVASGGDLRITGNGAADTVIDGAHAHRPFTALSAPGVNLVLRQLSVRNGQGGGGSLNGGAIYFSGASLTLDGIDFSGNAVASGSGGAVYASAAVTIENSLFAANRSNMGGAFEIWDGPLLVRNTTVTGTLGNNTVIVFGGAAGARARLVNVSVVDNASRGIQVRMNAALSLTNSLVAGNGGYDVGVVDSATVDLATSFNNVIGVQSGAGVVDGANGNRIGVADALVGALGDHGGTTRTIPLLPGSPALNAGTATGSDIPAADQRGMARVGTPDVGALESRGFSLVRGGGSGQSAGVAAPFADPLEVQLVANSDSEPVEGGKVVFQGPASGPGVVLASPVATIGVDGRARTAITANALAGGPYTVTARAANGDGTLLATDFSLTNVDGTCAAFTFPYTLSGTGNAARVAELRQAIECANANTTDDEIDLGAHTLVFADAPYVDANGVNALPIVTSALTLHNGTLERQAEAPAFRFLDVAAAGGLSVRAMQLRNGMSGAEGGAIRADGELMLRGSVFEDNRAATRGGAVASHAMTTVVTSRFERNTAVDGAAIAGGNGDAVPGGDVTMVLASRFEHNGDGTSRSVIWNTSYFAMVGSLVAGNRLSAADSSLMTFTDATAVAEMRNVTVADNVVQGELLSWQTANVQVRNSIVWGNQYGSLGRISPIHSILPGVAAVGGNLDQPPGFVDAPHDYRLASGSPAIDAGDNQNGFVDVFDVDEDGDTSEMLPDLDLSPRPLDDAGVVDTGNGTAPVIDIGAYEYQTASAAAGITVTPTVGLVTTEAGGSATFTVVLDRYPGADVVLPVSSSNTAEGIVAPASLTFTQADWNRPKTVTVLGMDDDIVDGDQAYIVVLGAVASGDPAYDGLDPPDVSVVNQDDEAATHRVGGTVTGLVGSGLVLSLGNGNESLPIDADGGFAFATPLAPGETYAISVVTQPSQPVQRCVVVNGSGTMGTTDIANVVVNCGASFTYAIGGTVSGLTGTGLTLQLNGGGDLPLSADGGYAFVPRLVDGASYVVTIRTQPSGQLCTLADAVGAVQGADVTDVQVSCAPLQAELYLTVDDSHAFTRYGQTRDYFVTLGNAGNTLAQDVAIAAAFSAAFDVANVYWQCLSGGSIGCAGSGSGGFSDRVDLPANSSVTWVVSVPVFAGSQEPDATLTVGPDGAPRSAGVSGASVNPASDTNTLVIFRDGSDVPYGDGASAIPDVPLRSIDPRGIVVDWPPAGAEGLHVAARLRTPHGTVQLQRLSVRGKDFVRLLGSDGSGQERISDWAEVAAGSRLVVGCLEESGNGSVVLLEGAGRALQLLQGRVEKPGDVR